MCTVHVLIFISNVVVRVSNILGKSRNKANMSGSSQNISNNHWNTSPSSHQRRRSGPSSPFTENGAPLPDGLTTGNRRSSGT